MAKVVDDTNRPARLRFSSAVVTRYVDAYRAANVTTWFGTLIKVLGGVLGFITFMWMADSIKSPIGGVVFGALVAAVYFFIGVLVAAQGQLLKATLDTAVNSSPFLTDDQRTKVMSLGAGTTGRGGIREGIESEAQQTQVGNFCYHCGAESSENATRCPSCGKEL